jgi:hypothetical protein
MKRTALLATTAFIALSAPAFADGKGGSGLIGFGEFGYDYTSLDDVDVDINSFHARGSTLWKLDGNWNVQGNFGFNTDRFDTGGADAAIDIWKVGGTAFWRDASQGAFGAELYYQSVDLGANFDGIGIAGRGEFYVSPQATIGGRVGYSSFDATGTDADEWSFNAQGRYYLQPQLGLKLGLNYNSWDIDGGEGFDEWSLRGEAEYLFKDCDTSVYAGLGFGNIEPDSGADADYWTIGLGVRMHFGTNGDLVQRHRTGPIEDLSTTRLIF